MSRVSSERSFIDVLRRLDGNFAMVLIVRDEVQLAVDKLRSIPLFYRQTGKDLIVSDDIRFLRRDEDATDHDSLIEYSTAGYVTGAHTLFSEIGGLQSGECVSWNASEEAPRAQRYYRYCCSYDAEESVEELFEKFDEALLLAFRRIIESVNGRQVVVPLSAGFDSRLVAATLKRCRYDNVLCFSYGIPGNNQEARSRETATKLGYRWVQVPYSATRWREALSSKEIGEYWAFSANGTSLPHPDDWLAVKLLKESYELSDDAVFVPGHTGDFICGSHLKNVFDPWFQEDPYDLEGAIIKKHYSLWENLASRRHVREVILHRLSEALESFPRKTDEDLARMYEYWEWQERQAKFIVNSVRGYEFFGYSWRLPLWDCAIMDFWKRIPISLKMDKYLYRAYLTTHDPMGVFQGVVPKGLWNRKEILRQRAESVRGHVKRKLESRQLLARLLHRYRGLRRHFQEYRNHPVGLARAYGLIRYLVRDSSKRHAQALLVKDVLDRLYGVRLSDLRAGNTLGSSTIIKTSTN